ncbi:SH3 domain-containing protein [Roseovarius aestuarii]|uniref:Bacterial SH3 domain protein n=2 Tax=Roseovarius aestuarii TaxID=475083 RepID=A0A1X7BS94_9RHOB|nr:SH3 domain-containing protein [Roseovarius aestuarii]SMC12477.1 Bacterial SH3 domain protein [Roseovarius aestuarii]
MWRFMLVSFAFLGWSFYVLSGGADYEPRLQSIQARTKLDDTRPLARPGSIQVAELAEAPVSEGDAARALPLVDDLDVTKKGGVAITLASVSADEIVEPEFEADAAKTEDLTQAPEIVDTPEIPADQLAPLADTRRVTGFIVNLRDGPSTFYLAIGSLSEGTAVEVLENPGEDWLRIRVSDTGQEGWIADWLVTAAAN